MDAEEALRLVEQALGGERLSKLQAIIFRYAWAEQSYHEIAKGTDYDIGYLKQAGSQLWKMLSNALGEKVSKSSVHSALGRYLSKRQVAKEYAIAGFPPILSSSTPLSFPYQDWGEATDVSMFLGRLEELTILERWIERDRCRLVGLFGMGGIGKTALSVKLARRLGAKRQEPEEGEEGPGAEADPAEGDPEDIPPHPSTPNTPFQYIIWRSLRNAPPIRDLLADLILFLSNQRETRVPDRLDQQILRLLEYLRVQRCLLILDNAETVMQAGDRDGNYQPGHEGYGQLLRCIGEADHQSCLLLTSREKPRGFAPREGETLPVRSLQVNGLPLEIGRELFDAKGTFSGSAREWQALITYYAGNPLALKIVATAIADFFDGNIFQFLEFSRQGGSVFGDIRDLLARQIGRLSELEQQIMIWLAINREAVSFAELQIDCTPPVPVARLLETLAALERRSLIERSGNLFTLQPVVMEYMTERLIDQACVEISLPPTHPPITLRTYALIKGSTKDYIREAQIRLILQPMLGQLLNQMNQTNLDHRLMQILESVRGQPHREMGYVGGNVINLLGQLQVELGDRDFSRLTIWQAYLRQTTLHGTCLAHSDLAKSVFTETFSQILSVAFSPDSQLFAASDISYEVHVWRVSDGKKLFTCRASDGWAWAVSFSPDGRLLASSANGTLHFWSAHTGECIKTIQGFTSRVFSLAFSPDGSHLASANEDHQIRIWHVETGTLVTTLQGHTDEVQSVAFSPNGTLLASGSYDCTVRLWDVSTLQEPSERATDDSRQRLPIACFHHSHWVWSVVFSPDGTTLASSSSDRTIKRWDVQTGHCIQTLTGHTQPVRALCFAPPSPELESSPPTSPLPPTSSLLVSGSDDHTIRLWDSNGECLRVLQGHTSWVSSVACSPNGRLLVSGSEDQSVRLWDRRTNHCLQVLQGYNSGVWSIAFSPDGNTLISGGQDRIVRLWPVSPLPPSPPPHVSLPGHTSWIWSVAVSPDGGAIASASEDCTIRVWQIPSPDPRPPTPDPHHSSPTILSPTILKGHYHAVWSTAFSLDGQIIASGSLDCTVRLWDRQTGTCQHVLKHHRSGVCSVAFAPRILAGNINEPVRQLLASGSQDQTIQLWEITTIKAAQTDKPAELVVQATNSLVGHTSWIRCISFSPDGTLLASSSSDGIVKLWNVAQGRCVQTFSASSSLVLAVAFSPNGHVFATGDGSGVVRVWDMTAVAENREGEARHWPHPDLLQTLHGHERWIRFLAYSPDGSILASCSQDGTIRLWESESGICLAPLRVPRPYEGSDITGVTGLTEAQKETLRVLGATENLRET